MYYGLGYAWFAWRLGLVLVTAALRLRGSSTGVVKRHNLTSTIRNQCVGSTTVAYSLHYCSCFVYEFYV